MSSVAPSTLAERIAAPGVTLAGWAVLVMMLVDTSDVIGTMFGHPVAGAHELVEILMVIVIFLALPYAESRNQHIAVDLVFNRLPAAVQRGLRLTALALSLLFFAAMAWQAWKLFWASWVIREYATGAVRFPVYPSKALFALGVTLAVAVLVIKLGAALRGGSAARGQAQPAPNDQTKQEMA